MRGLLLPPENQRTGERKTHWQRIARNLRRSIASGRAAPGEWLPPLRELGRTFGVHRHTVAVAIDVLVAEGLLETVPRRGVRVVAAPLGPSRGRLTPARAFDARLVRGTGRSPAELLAGAPTGTIVLHSAVPDVSLLPRAELRAAYASVFRGAPGRFLEVPDARGFESLRVCVARYLRRARGLVTDDVLLTHGSQEAIALAAEVLLAPGDAVGVEEPGYLPALEVFRELGAELVPLPVDEHGLRVDALQAVLARRSLRLLYVTPNHQYPTTATLSAPRRAELLALTRRHAVPVLEDDYDHEYHYRGTPQAPLAAWDGAEHVVYVGSLSKLVAPGIRCGFATGAPAVVGAMLRRRGLVTRGNDGVTQAALADWMDEGGFERHLRRVRRVYERRRDAALAVLERARRRAAFRYIVPDGGLAVWTLWPEHDVLALARAALVRGVTVLPEPLLRTDAAGSGLRVAFGAVSEPDFARGVERLLAAARSPETFRKR